MRNIILFLSAAVILVLVNYSIWQREALISSGRTVLLELAPVDPRSLMQGDYMSLRFKLANDAFPPDKIKGLKDGTIILAVDSRNIATFRRFADGKRAADEALLRYRIRNGQPKLADPEGIVGWTKGENEVLIQSEFDVWNYSISSGKLTSITNEKGKATNTRLSKSVWTNDSVYVDYKNVYIRGFNETTKGNIFYELVEKSVGLEMVELYSMDSDLNSIRKSKNGNAIIFRKANVLEYPDLILMDNQFKNEKKISITKKLYFIHLMRFLAKVL